MVRSYRRLGEILLDRGAVSYLDLSIALADQKVSRRRLGEILVSRGFASEAEVVACVAQQSGCPVIDLSEVTPKPEALRLLKVEDALNLEVLPIELTQNGLVVAVSNPTDNSLLDQLSSLVRCNIILQTAGSISLQKTIRRVYGMSADQGEGQFAEGDQAPKRYVELIGRGRMGSTVIFDAVDRSLDRTVTLTCVPTGDSAGEALARAVRSASMGAVPGILPIYDFLSEGLYQWTVMPRVQGDSLQSILKTLGPRTLVQSAEIVSKVAESLDELQKCGGHGNWICPENIFQGLHGIYAVPLAAKPANYQSPTPDHDAENPGSGTAYALGCLLRDCIYGTTGTHNRSIPSAMRTILENALARQPQDRYGSAIEVASALRSFNWQALSDPLAISGDLHRDRLLNSLDANQKDLYEKPSLIDRITKKKRAA